MLIDHDASDDFVQRFSIWKTLGMEFLLIGGAVIPLFPGFSIGLRYFSFLYRMPFLLLLVAACVILALFSIGLLPILWLALRRVPVLIISKDQICVSVIRKRCVSKSIVIRSIAIWPGGNLNLELIKGKPIAIPIFVYENSLDTKRRIEEFVLNEY